MSSENYVECLEPRRLFAVVRVLALGDSITSGSGDNQSDLVGQAGPRYEVARTAGGYRRYLKAFLADAGYAIDFVGNVRGTVAPAAGNLADPLYAIGGAARVVASSLVDDPESGGFPGYPIVNDAAPGIQQIAGAMTDAAMATLPDVVLLHAGTNDITATADVARQVSDFAVLLGQIYADAPAVKVIVAPLIAKQGWPQVDQFNRGIHDLVRAAAAEGRNIVWAGAMATALAQDAKGSPDFVSDRIHPNLLGYSKMARVWADAILATPAVPPVAAPQAFDFDDAAAYRQNFFNLTGTAAQPVAEGGGILRFTDPASTGVRYGSVLFDPSDTTPRNYADATVTADFRASAANSTLGIYLRLNGETGGGYLGRVVIDSAGATDRLAVFKNAVAATPAVLPAESAATTTTALVPGAWYTLQFSATNDTDGKTVALSLAVYARDASGEPAGPALMRSTWTDTAAPILSAGQIGLRFGYAAPLSRVDVDRLRLPAASALPALPESVPPASDVETAPAAPTGLRLKGFTSNSLALCWSAAADATGYVLQRSADGGAIWSDTPLPGDATSCAVDRLLPAVAYQFRIRALGRVGASAASDVLTTSTQPTAPRNLRAAPTDAGITLRWSDSTGESTYRLEWLVAGKWKPLRVLDANVTSYTPSALIDGMTYSFRLVALNATGPSWFSNTAIVSRG